MIACNWNEKMENDSGFFLTQAHKNDFARTEFKIRQTNAKSETKNNMKICIFMSRLTFCLFAILICVFCKFIRLTWQKRMERTNSLQLYLNEFYGWIRIHIHHHAKQENELQKRIPHKILIPL